MPTSATLLTVLAALLVLEITPGPDMMLVLARGIGQGRRTALLTVFGMVVMSGAIQISLLILGVASLTKAYPTSLVVLKWLGAAYLAWLGFKMLVAKPGDAPVLNIEPRHYFKQALFITLLNPKAIVFYMAFFPLFVDPARHQGLLTFGVMALTIAVLTFAYGLGATLLTHFLAERMRANPVVGRILEKVAGVFLIGFGVKLAISK